MTIHNSRITNHDASVQLLCWFGAIVLFAVGLIGTVLPVFPGAVIIFGAAVLHRMVLGENMSLGWHGLALLALLTAISYGIDLFAAYLGAKHFGATRWGTVGAAIGAVAGLFFGIVGILIGPVLGVFAGELVGGKRLVAAGRASWGSLLGNFAGMVAKLLIALVMITFFLANVSSPF